jgi:hypothetical protein
MINHDYLVDTSWCDSGGYCDFLPIRGHQNLGFKSFKNKTRARKSLINQLILNKFDFAPSVLTPLCKIAYWYDPQLLKKRNWSVLILAMKVLKDMLMHGEIFVPAQNVAIAIDLNVVALTIMIERKDYAIY